MKVIEILLATERGRRVLARLIELRLLSPSFSWGDAPPPDEEPDGLWEYEKMMGHDAYRRVRGRLVQARWSA